MIIFIEDRKFSNKTVLKEPKDVAWILNLMLDELAGIDDAFGELSMAFLDKNWNLQEGQAETLSAYSLAAEKIRNRLTNLIGMNAKLYRFLASEERPINVDRNAPQRFDHEIDIIIKRLNFYYKTVKWTLFPRFDNEVKQCRDVIADINGNIDRINVINSAHRIRPIRHVKNLTFKESCSSRNKRRRSV
jgi:hypothetical protein